MAAAPKKKPPGPKKTKLKKEIEVVLRERAKASETKVNALETQVAFHENVHLKLTRTAAAAEADAEAMFNAIRTLAEAIGTDTATGRKAREEARFCLEIRKIRPPHSLGASRKRKSRKKRS